MSRLDERELASLYDRYAAAILARSRAVCGNPADAEEVLQETFLRAWKARRRYEPRNPLGWLHTIAYRASIWLVDSPADTRLAFVDACESGTLARIRGGTPVDAIELTVDDTLATSGFAVITSSGPLSVARESTQFGGGVFSQALLSGLRGGADRNRDGAVTLEETYAHVFAETVRDTARSGEAIQRPEYRRSLTGIGEIVLTRLAEHAAGLVFPVELEGAYTVVSVQTGHVVARIDKAVGEDRRISLPSGRYVVRKVRRADVLVGELDLAWGGERWVSDEQMTSVPLGDPLARGGGPFDRPHELTVGGAASTPLIQANPPLGGLELGLRLRLVHQGGIALRLGGELGVRADLDVNVELVVGSASLTGWIGRSLRRTDLRLGAGVRAVHVDQWVYAHPVVGPRLRRVQRSVGFTSEVDWRLPLGSTLELTLGPCLDAMPLRIDDRLQIRVQARGHAALGLRFGGRSRGRLSSRPAEPDGSPDR